MAHKQNIMPVTYSRWKMQRNKALEKGDIDWVMGQLHTDDRNQAEVVLHKMCFECTDIPAGLRRASGLWLLERGYSRMTGEGIQTDMKLTATNIILPT